jgi:hypothetical protein
MPTLEALPGRVSDLAGLPIRRLLPRSQRRLVGPWCFLDSFGPLGFPSGKPMDVAPHPHIGLQTVSWLLEGEVRHHDSLGLTGLARPGAVNLMTAGRGIAHSEETPAENAGRLWGVQLWVALPGAAREVEPAFEHHATVPSLELEGGLASVILGRLAGVTAPGRTYTPLVGAEIRARSVGRVAVPLEEGFEHALVVLEGECRLDGQQLVGDTLYYLGSGRRDLVLAAEGAGLRALLLGGAPFEETILMWWNFVARTSDEIAAAREDWQAGRRFGEVRAYEGPRLPAPPMLGRPATAR